MLELLVEFRNGTRKSFLFRDLNKAIEIQNKLENLGYLIIYLKCWG